MPWNPLLSLELFAISACIFVWFLAFIRATRRRPTVPYQPRRPVPWQAIDLAAIILFFLFSQSAMIEVVRTIHGTTTQVNGSAVDEATTAHAVAQLLHQASPWVLLLCGFSAVVVAPLTEEFFFRVVLQGWLEALWHRNRRRMPAVHRLFGSGVVPVLLTSLFFAMAHFRIGAPRFDPNYLLLVLGGDAISRLFSLAFAIGWLRIRAGANAVDMGWVPERFWPDIELGVCMFWAVAIPVYAMQATLNEWLPKSIAPDPIPLFFFALAQGAVYFRTHRIMPLVVFHMVFNATSLVFAVLGS
jgi:membrane protease YdiL (CAAX protease family)